MTNLNLMFNEKEKDDKIQKKSLENKYNLD